MQSGINERHSQAALSHGAQRSSERRSWGFQQRPSTQEISILLNDEGCHKGEGVSRRRSVKEKESQAKMGRNKSGFGTWPPFPLLLVFGDISTDGALPPLIFFHMFINTLKRCLPKRRGHPSSLWQTELFLVLHPLPLQIIVIWPPSPIGQLDLIGS